MNESLIGQIFGRLTVQRIGPGILEKNKDKFTRRASFICLCSCGKEVHLNKRQLVSGNTKSCGCLRGETYKMNKFHLQTNLCEVCGNPFNYKANKKSTCSDKCAKIRKNSYNRFLHRKSFSNILRSILSQTKSKSKKKNQTYDLDLEFLQKLLEKQENKCNQTKIPFEISVGNGCKGVKFASPWSISIDRIDSSKGYTKDNVQLVCLMYNLCKSSWTDKEVLKFVNSFKQ